VGCVHGEGDPLTIGIDDRTQWVIDRIVDLHPGTETHNFEPPIAVQVLQEALRALQGHFHCTLFGLSSSSIAADRHPEVIALLNDALAAWRDWAIRTDKPWLVSYMSDRG
jgi:hypothetical protein